MRRGAWVLAVVIAARATSAGLAAAPGSPEDVVERAMASLNKGKLDGFVKAMHPEALEEFRTLVVQGLDEAERAGKAEELLRAFGGAAKPEDLRGLDGGGMLAKMLEAATADPGTKEALAGTRIEALGRFMQQDRAYVVYESKVKFGELSIDRLSVAVLRKSGGDWKLDLPDDIAGKFAEARRSRLAGEDAPLPDFKQARIEPIGHVMEGKAALVVYRMSIPVRTTTFSQLAVLKVKPDDPGWDAARKDRMDEVKTVVEKSLGLVKEAPKPLSPAQQKRLDQMQAAMEKEAEKNRAEMTARSREAREAQKKEMDAFAEASRKKMEAASKAFRERVGGATAPTAPGAPDAAALPDGLVAIPATFVGGGRDLFRDLAPAEGILIGVRVSFASKLNGPSISSVQPVYRVDGKPVAGERHGSLLGKETEIVAKPGYAVGAVKMRAAVSLHGFELVFMKVDGDHLDPATSYSSRWLGNERSGLERNVSTNGKIPVGLQGKADEAVKALGLIARP